jgi:dienelactone hydrolase
MVSVLKAPRVPLSSGSRIAHHLCDLDQNKTFTKKLSRRLRALPLETSKMASSLQSSQSSSAIALEKAIRRGRDHHLLGSSPPARPSTSTSPLPSCLDNPNFVVEDLEYYSEDPENPASLPSQCWVPLRLVKKQQQSPSSHALPVVIFIHCTGSDLNSQALRQAQYAEKGYLAAAIDTRYHGARADPNMPYQKALVKAWKEASAMFKSGFGNKNTIERPFLMDVVWDLQRLLDYLVTQRTNIVDPTRIGATGESLGGMTTWLLAAADDRIAAVAPICGVQNFRYAIENDLYHARVHSIPYIFIQAAKDMGKIPEGTDEKQGNLVDKFVDREVVASVWDKIMPGFLSDHPENSFDAPYSLGLIAPRPCLILNGQKDDKTPLTGVKLAVEEARATYKKALSAAGIDEKEHEERLRLFIQSGVGHEFTPRMHREVDLFMDKWLLRK